MSRLGVIGVFALSACGSGTRFGKIITEVTVSPTDPRLLLVKSCELLNTPKAKLEQVAIGDCKRYGVRRTAIVPVPVAEARVLAREDRIVTGFVERPNGGAIVTTCKLAGTRKEKNWQLLDCSDTEISTAPLEAADHAPPTAPTVPVAPEAPPVTP